MPQIIRVQLDLEIPQSPTAPQVHGLIYRWLETADPDIARACHAGASSVSPSWWQTQTTLELELRTLNDVVGSALRRGLQRSAESIRLGQSRAQFQQVKTERLNPDTFQDHLDEINAALRRGNREHWGQAALRLRTLSPLSFRRSGRDCAEPTPALLIGSVQRQLRAAGYAAPALTAQGLELGLNGSVEHWLAGHQWVQGHSGDLELTATTEVPSSGLELELLRDLSHWMHFGSKINFGMGATSASSQHQSAPWSGT